MLGQRKLRGVGYEQSRTQDFTTDAIRSLIRKNPILDSNIVSVDLVSGENQISHGLGREVQGWTIIDKQKTADVWRSQSENTLPEKFIILECDDGSDADPVTVKIIFF